MLNVPEISTTLSTTSGKGRGGDGGSGGNGDGGRGGGISGDRGVNSS
jgi:hypothetical protein